MANEVIIIRRLLILIVLAGASASKLNVARILLPVFDDISANFTLHSTDNDCLLWSTTRDDIVKLAQFECSGCEGGCSSSIVISTNTKERSRQTADIFAEDSITKQIVRCVVVIDVIHSLEITTKTRELILEEAPEIFEVRAYDNQGNEFSTLAGVPLHWFISPLGIVSDMPVIKLTPFKDSSYGTPESLVDLEERGLWGDKVLIEGFKTGMSKVSVKLSQKEYEDVKSNDIVLSVVANLMILPPEVYIMAGDVVRFRVIQTSYGNVEEIDLNTSQYYLKVVDTAVATDQREPGVVKGQALGETKIYLHDKNIASTKDSDVILPLPCATIKVVQPAYMLLNLLPFKNWVTVVSERHEIVAEIYTEEDRKITLGSDFNIQTTVGEAFHVQERASNGSWQTGWTETEGVAMVTAILDSIKPPLQATGEMIIYPRISLTPSEVILPWDPTARPKYDVDLKATGGDGKFLWSSTNHSVGIVTQMGKVHTHNIGSFEVSAAMQKNHNMRETAKFSVLPPSKLEIVEFDMESPIGTFIFLHVALYVEKEGRDGMANSQIPVTRCQDLNFKVRTSDPKFAYRKSVFIETIGIACGNMAIFSSEVGTAKVTVSYQIGDTTLQDSVTLTYFKPLKLLQPSGQIVLAVGAATNLIFTGGPRSKNGLQLVEVETTGDEFVEAVDETAKHQMPPEDEYTVVRALCRKLGQSNVTMRIVNPPSIPNCRNQEASATVTVTCGKPRKIEVQPEIKVADASSCPMDLSSERMIVQSNQEIDLLVKVLDSEGREFINVSSLSFVFDTKPAEKADIGQPTTVYERTGIIGTAVYANKSYQVVTPKIETGEIVLTVSVIGYNSDVLKGHKIQAESPEFADELDDAAAYVPINASISLVLVDDTVVTPDEISIYNHPSNKMQVDVKQGSGFYSISMTRDDVVQVQYLESSRKLDIMPLARGEVDIKLIDLCLVNKPAQVHVQVVSIHAIRAEMSDKVELGKCITCTVSLYDDSGAIMSVPNLELIEMSHVMDNNIAHVERLVSPISILLPGQLEYVISGVELGDARLIFYIGDPDFEGYVASDPMELQVFPPLKVMPRCMTLAVGAVMQYSCKGGPQPSSDMEFAADDDQTALICTHGVATGLVEGRTKVAAKAVGSTGSSQKVIYTEDSAELEVINLAGVRITAPSMKVKVGAKLPIWASGRPEQITPLILATIKPPIIFQWTVEDAHIARIYDVVDNSRVDGPSPNLPFVRLMGLQPGSTVVSLNATTVRNKKITVFVSTLEFDVVDSLQLREPLELAETSIYMTPNSQTQLLTNAEENDYEISYKLMSNTPFSTEVQYKSPSNMNIAQVTSTGLLSTNSVTGTAIVLASSVDHAGTKQNLIIPIEIKPVHYMMLTLSGSWQSASGGTHCVPLGSEFELAASYFDNMGNKLISAGMETSVRLSRSDLATLHRKTNDTFSVLTKKPGVTVLQVISEGSDKILDYVKLNVTQVIQPFADELIVGDVICYQTPVKMSFEATWTSSDPTILKVDPYTGMGVAVAPGKATVFHSYHKSAPMQLTISPIGNIVLDAHNTTFTNTQEYKLHATIQSTDHQRTNNLLSSYDCSEQFCCFEVPSPLKCSLTFDNAAISPDLFEVTARFDAQVGKHYCSIAPKPEAVQKGNNWPKSDAYLYISAEGCDCVPKQAKLNFVPGVQKPEDVSLDGNTLEGTLIINGAPDALASLSVHSKDENVLWVGDRQQEGSTLTFTVQLLNGNNLNVDDDRMVLEVEAESSDQRLLVGVSIEEGTRGAGATCSKPESSLLVVLHSNRFILSVILGFILMITLCTYAYLNYVQQPAINVNVMPTSTCPPSPPMRNYNLSGTLAPSMTMMDSSRNSGGLDHSCYCTRSPEIRRNRRYL